MFVCVFVYDGRCLFVFVFASASNVCINVREPPCSHMFVYVHVRAVVWRTADTGLNSVTVREPQSCGLRAQSLLLATG